MFAIGRPQITAEPQPAADQQPAIAEQPASDKENPPKQEEMFSASTAADQILARDYEIKHLKNKVDTTKRYKENLDHKVKKQKKKLKSQNTTIIELTVENERRSAELAEKNAHISTMKEKLIAKDQENLLE